MKTVLIGHKPAHGADPRRPLDGPGSGRRLWRLSGLERYEDYLAAFERVNLVYRYSESVTRADERRLARKLARRYAGRRVILLGRDVARAFGVYGDYFRWQWLRLPEAWLHVATAPHPSGLCRWWNEKRNVRRAEKFFREVAR